MLNEMIEVMKQGVEDFDYDLVQSIVNSMSGYRIPEDFIEPYKKLKIALADVDFDGMSEVLELY